MIRPGDIPRFPLLLGLVLGGCAPLGTLRPASGLMPARSGEVGLAGVALGPRPYVTESTELAGQAWATLEPLDWLSVSAITAVSADAAAAGGAVRWNAFRTRRTAGGIEAEAGYAWVAGSLGFAVRTFGETWLYAAPRVGTLGFSWTVGTPVGVSAAVWDGLIVRAEAQVSWAELKHYNRRVHGGLGVAWQW